MHDFVLYPLTNDHPESAVSVAATHGWTVPDSHAFACSAVSWWEQLLCRLTARHVQTMQI